MKEEVIEGELAYIPSKYSKALNIYSKTQVRVIMPFLNSISKTCDFSSQYPVCKVLKAVSKIFLLNQIQVIFLAYLIRQTKWDVKDKIIYSNADHVQDIVCYSIESLDYKRVILYLMVSAYTVKYYLNENNNQAMEQAIKRCPNFKKVFETWAKKHSAITTKINPRTLNIVYKELYTNVRNEKPDFNTMVDAILQISPAYNPERDRANKEEKKKNQQNSQNLQQNVSQTLQKEVEQQKNQINVKSEKQDKSGFSPNQPLFSSSGIMGLMHQTNQENKRKDSVSSLNPFLPSKNQNNEYRGMLGSSLVRGLNSSNYDIKDDGDCGEIMLGLQQGQSEQNIYFDNDGNTNMMLPSNASTVNLSNGLEIAQKYLSPESKVGKRIQ